MPRAEKIFAGAKLRNARERYGLAQKEFAERLGVSVSYLSQMESDARPITVAVLLALGREFSLSLSEFSQDGASRLASDIREALADPVFAKSPPTLHEIKRAVAHTPAVAQSLVDLHQAYRQLHERLQTMDEAINARSPDRHLLPWEEVRDYFHYRDNYVDEIDSAAEQLIDALGQPDQPPSVQLEQALASRHRIRVRLHRVASDQFMRRYDPAAREVHINADLPPESRAFLVAHQLALVEFADLINSIADAAAVRTTDARRLLQVGLANYAAGALLMPYGRFIAAAQRVKHDIEQLQHLFGVSFEQACHRLSNLQRPSERGVPFFFVRVDMAGNITKRHSATRLQFARYGGACPLWNVHEAVASPGRISVQLAEMPDGVRYVCMARGLLKSSGSYLQPSRRYAVALGCEVSYASQFIYAAGLDLDDPRAVSPIGSSCRICPRTACVQRAFPPTDRPTRVDPNDRRIVPYMFE